LNPMFSETKSVVDIESFKNDDTLRVLIIANENAGIIDLNALPFLLHFDLPEDKEIFISRVVKTTGNEETLAITFATDIELATVKKIEQAIGKKIPLTDLPDDLVIDTEHKEKEASTEKKADKNESVAGAAFHEKKAANAKTYNYSSGTKAKMNNKRKHG
jgi:superfamily II DNA/RNA helicase